MNRWIRTCAVLAVLMAALTVGASAMHIAEGYLPVGWAIGWGVVCVPFVAAGLAVHQPISPFFMACESSLA